MGLESLCVAVIDGKRVDGKLMLEGDELILRGGEKPLKYKLSSLKKLTADKSRLSATTKGVDVCFQIEGDAAKWLKKIQNPPTRESKLGIKAGTKVFLSGEFEEEFVNAVKPHVTSDPKEADLLLLSAERGTDLKKAKRLRVNMKPAAAIWIIYPKGIEAIREIDVLETLRSFRLKDVKVMSFCPTHTGLKFVIPVSERHGD